MLVYRVLYFQKLFTVWDILWKVKRKISKTVLISHSEIVIVPMIQAEMAQKVYAVWVVLETAVLNVEIMVGSASMEQDCRWTTLSKYWYFWYTREKTPIDGGLSEWSDWSRCSTVCNKERTRECNSPYAMFGGIDCVGHLKEETEENSCFFEDCCPGFSER